MTTVQISSTPAFPSADLLHVLEQQGYRAAVLTAGTDDDDTVTLRIDNPTAALEHRVLAALDELIRVSGLPLLSERVDPGRYVVHPAAG